MDARVVIGVATGLGLVVIGLGLLVFAVDIQAWVLRYHPPPWYESIWRGIVAHFIRGSSYVWGLRLSGAITTLFGLVVIFLMLR